MGNNGSSIFFMVAHAVAFMSVTIWGTSFYSISILKFFSIRSVRREMQPWMITLTMNVEISFMKLLSNTYQM